MRGTAQAQQPPAEADTARRSHRDGAVPQQNLQDTPIAITAVTGEMLEARSQTSIAEVVAQAPNVLLTPQAQASGSGLIAYIRGVGQTDFNYALEPGVGIYVDDVYIPTLTGSLLELLDLDRVEILRGPQGTLAGRNSIGGAIKLFSSKAEGDGGSVSLTYGSFNRVDARASGDFTRSTISCSCASRRHQEPRRLCRSLDYGCSHPGSGVPTLRLSQGCKLGTQGGVSYAAGRMNCAGCRPTASRSTSTPISPMTAPKRAPTCCAARYSSDARRAAPA